MPAMPWRAACSAKYPMAPAWVTLRAAHQPICTALARPMASSIARVMPMTPGARSASSTAIAPARRSTFMAGRGLMAFFFRRST
jgi:hypothetical protein